MKVNSHAIKTSGSQYSLVNVIGWIEVRLYYSIT
jgi:hypothetical protein